MKFALCLALTLVTFVSLNVFGGETATRFEKLAAQSASDPKAKISALLRHYGEVSEFKIIEEVSSQESCLRESRMHAKVVCEKKGVIKKSQYFAEGKGLLCKVADNLDELNCLIAQ